MSKIIESITKKQLLLLFFTLSFNVLNAFSQRGFEDYEEYDWREFKSSNFLMASCICAVVIGFGLYLQKNASSKLIEKTGKIIVWIGGIFAFGSLGGPILGAIEVLWKVGVGIAIFVGLIYWIKTDFIDKK